MDEARQGKEGKKAIQVKSQPHPNTFQKFEKVTCSLWLTQVEERELDSDASVLVIGQDPLLPGRVCTLSDTALSVVEKDTVTPVVTGQLCE